MSYLAAACAIAIPLALKAQTKIDQLGLADFDKVALTLTDGPTEIEFSAQDVAVDSEAPTEADGVD